MGYNANAFGAANTYTVHLQQWFHINVQGIPELEFAVQSLPLPTEGNEAVEVHHGNSKAYQAGKASFEGGSFTFADMMGLNVAEKLNEWRNQVYDKETGVMGWQEAYKRSIEITAHGPDGQVYCTWVLHGAWPSSVNWGQLDYNANDKRTVEATITYDWGEVKTSKINVPRGTAN